MGEDSGKLHPWGSLPRLWTALGVGTMIQQVRASLAALPEDLSSNSQHAHDTSQPSVMPIPGDQIPLKTLYACAAHMYGESKTPIGIK